LIYIFFRKKTLRCIEFFVRFWENCFNWLFSSGIQDYQIFHISSGVSSKVVAINNVLLSLLWEIWLWLRVLLDDPLAAHSHLPRLAHCLPHRHHLCHVPAIQGMLCRMCALYWHPIWGCAAPSSLCWECHQWYANVLSYCHGWSKRSDQTENIQYGNYLKLLILRICIFHNCVLAYVGTLNMCLSCFYELIMLKDILKDKFNSYVCLIAYEVCCFPAAFFKIDQTYLLISLVSLDI